MAARAETRNSPSDDRPDRTSRTADTRRVRNRLLRELRNSIAPPQVLPCRYCGGGPAKAPDRQDPADQTKHTSESHLPLQLHGHTGSPRTIVARPTPAIKGRARYVLPPEPATLAGVELADALFGGRDAAVELGEGVRPRLRVAEIDAQRREQVLR